MATINISIDTEKKDVSVKVGSKKLDNVSGIYISTEDSGYFGLEISQNEEMEGIRKVTRLYASENDTEWQEKEPDIDYDELSAALGQKNS